MKDSEKELFNKLLKYSQQNAIKIDNIDTTLFDVIDNLNFDNPFHSDLRRQIETNIVHGFINSTTEKNGQSGYLNQNKIKYRSKVNINEIAKNIVPLKIFENIPNTDNIFGNNNYNNKFKRNFALNTNNTTNTNNNNNAINIKSSNIEKEEENEDKKKFDRLFNNNNNNNYHRFNNTINGIKRRQNEVSIDYEAYNNSIYNNNRKKKKNNRYNYKNKDEDDEEEEEVQPKVNEGFSEAINQIKNRNIFNQKKDDDDKKDKEKEKSTFRKFNPPYKKNMEANSEKKEIEEKESELDKKLKGFDKKLIDFIESEILTHSPNVKWDDIAGLDFAKKTIKEIIIWPMIRPDIFNGLLKPPKGLLLFGPPGTGKTMIAKAIASESNSKFFNISASSLMSKWIGESEKLVRTLFALASFYQPSVIFIDEIDSLLSARSENENEASRRIKTEFLVQLDGAGTNGDDRILIIGATNRPQEIDDAIIRRMIKRLYIPLPDEKSRLQLIDNVIKCPNKKNKYDISEEDIQDIIRRTEGYSGSDMFGVCREASMMPIRSIDDIHNIQLDNLRAVTLRDFIDALDLVKPSVSEKSIKQYVEWNEQYGTFQQNK